MDTITLEGLNLLKSFYNCHLSPVPNGFGSYYIGFNHITLDKNETITPEMADKFLLDDCQLYADYIDSQDIYLDSNQRNALIIFGFDCKIFGLKELLKESFNKPELIGNNMIKYYHSLDERSSEEILKRRVTEQKMFLSGHVVSKKEIAEKESK